MKQNEPVVERGIWRKIYRVLRMLPFRREWRRKYCLVRAWKLERYHSFKEKYRKELEKIYANTPEFHQYDFEKLFRDYWKCWILFDSEPMDYCLVVKRPWSIRKGYVTIGRLYYLNCVLDPFEDEKIGVPELDDKLLLYQRWSKYLYRIWADPFAMDEETFVRTFEGVSRVLVKPRISYGGYGIKSHMIASKDDLAELYRAIREENVPVLVEEYYKQRGLLNSFNPSTLNTLRVITIRGAKQTHVIASYFRCGAGSGFVDNGSQGGIAFPIDVETGTLLPGNSNSLSNVVEHPVSKIAIAGQKVPNWEQVKAFCIQADREAPEGVRLIGWDVCASDGELLLIEANTSPGFVSPTSPKDNQWKTCCRIMDELEENGVKLESKWL